MKRFHDNTREFVLKRRYVQKAKRALCVHKELNQEEQSNSTNSNTISLYEPS